MSCSNHISKEVIALSNRKQHQQNMDRSCWPRTSFILSSLWQLHTNCTIIFHQWLMSMCYLYMCVCVFIIKWEEPQMHDVRWCKLLPHQQQEWNQRRERGQVNPQTYGGSHITSNLNVDEYKYETSVTHFWRASKKASKWLTIW